MTIGHKSGRIWKNDLLKYFDLYSNMTIFDRKILDKNDFFRKTKRIFLPNQGPMTDGVLIDLVSVSERVVREAAPDFQHFFIFEITRIKGVSERIKISKKKYKVLLDIPESLRRDRQILKRDLKKKNALLHDSPQQLVVEPLVDVLEAVFEPLAKLQTEIQRVFGGLKSEN